MSLRDGSKCRQSRILSLRGAKRRGNPFSFYDAQKQNERTGDADSDSLRVGFAGCPKGLALRRSLEAACGRSATTGVATLVSQ